MKRGRLIAFDGETKAISAWAREIGMNEKLLRARLLQGWSAERAMTQAVERHNVASKREVA